MTTYGWLTLPRHNSNQDFRDWGSGIAGAFAAVGMTKTADTGQINWTTVDYPTVANTYMGYEIWRFNDSLQATYPLFWKVEYGCPASPAYLSLRITIGKGSDGAGNITSVLVPATAVASNTNSATASSSYASSADGSMLAISPATATMNSSTTEWSFVLERSRGVDGSATGIGFMFMYATTGAVPGGKAVNYATGGTLTMPRYPAAAWGMNASSLGAGGNTTLFPAIVTDGAGNWWQPRSVLNGLAADLGTFNTINVPGWGTYMPMGPGWTGWDGGAGTPFNGVLAWY